MTSKTKENIQNSFNSIFEFDSKAHELELKEQVLIMKFLGEIDEEMEKTNTKKKVLAKEVGTSAAYITQLFSGNRKPNFGIVTKMADALGMEFEVTTKEKLKRKSPQSDGEGLWIYKPFAEAKKSSKAVQYDPTILEGTKEPLAS